MKHKILKISIPLILIIFAIGCADLKDDLTQPGEISIHKDGIANTSSPNFHATTFRENNWDVESCQQCHASDYAGGTVGISCNGCHSNPGGPEACNTCHGSFDDVNRIAPPTDLSNNVETTYKGVGAHTSHVYENNISALVSCYECHPNQTAAGETYISSHIDGLPAEISIAGYNATETTCLNTYCHGNFQTAKSESSNPFGFVSDVISGNNFTPVWTTVNGTQSECGTCHGLPPAGHVAAELNNCFTCHPGVVDTEGNIIDPLKHIDGSVTLAGADFFNEATCSNCHGNDVVQPFKDITGSTDKSKRGVALHDEHLFMNNLGVEIGCESCHSVPAKYDSPDHFDATLHAELTFRHQAGTPNIESYNYNSMQCSNTYCHGNFSFGKSASSHNWGYTAEAISGNSATVTWQSPSQPAACGSCHGLQPTGHIAVESNTCNTCHFGVDNYTPGDYNAATHIDGNIQLASEDYFLNRECNNCHGNIVEQPFYGTAGKTSKTEPGVGLHDKHLFGSDISELKCEGCHIVPGRYDSEGHFDATPGAEVSFVNLPGSTVIASYNSATNKCGNTYCHGNFTYSKSASLYPWAYEEERITGTISTELAWVGSANEVVCGSCHGLPPTGHVDAELTECADCHAGIVDATGNIIDPVKHINGLPNVFGN